MARIDDELSYMLNDNNYERLKIYADHPQCSVRCILAFNPYCDISLLEKLANDVLVLRNGITYNPNCTSELREAAKSMDFLCGEY